MPTDHHCNIEGACVDSSARIPLPFVSSWTYFLQRSGLGLLSGYENFGIKALDVNKDKRMNRRRRFYSIKFS